MSKVRFISIKDLETNIIDALDGYCILDPKTRDVFKDFDEDDEYYFISVSHDYLKKWDRYEDVEFVFPEENMLYAAGEGFVEDYVFIHEGIAYDVDIFTTYKYDSNLSGEKNNWITWTNWRCWLNWVGLWK